MVKVKTVAARQLWKLCAVAFGVAAFCKPAAAQYANSADAYTYPFGLASVMDHQVKAWSRDAVDDSDDSIFYYSDAMPAPTKTETRTASNVANPSAAALNAQAAPALPPSTGSPVIVGGPIPSTPAVPELDTATPVDTSTAVREILKEYAADRITTSQAAALLANLMDASGANHGASPVAATSALATSASTPRIVAVTSTPAVSTWPIRANATIQETLAQWASMAGWHTPKWKAETDTPYRITNGTTLSGTFMDALRVLSNAVPQFDIHVEVATRNLIVSDAPQD
jgi:hypothetical protein